MLIKIDYFFSVDIFKEKIEIDEQIIVPTWIKDGKPSDYVCKWKEKEITVFGGLRYGYEDRTVIENNLYELIDFIELLKAFSGNKLIQKKTYRINKNIEGRIVTKEGVVSLMLIFFGHEKNYFEKYECSALAAKLSKVLSRCEPWRG